MDRLEGVIKEGILRLVDFTIKAFGNKPYQLARGVIKMVSLKEGTTKDFNLIKDCKEVMTYLYLILEFFFSFSYLKFYNKILFIIIIVFYLYILVLLNSCLLFDIIFVSFYLI